MSTPEDKQREFKLRKAKLQAKEPELRLRELEVEIDLEHKSREPKVSAVEPRLYNTRKHNPPKNSLQKFSRKIVRFAKFTSFVICGVAIIRVGFFIGM